jgi:hypothetical protein
MAGIDNTFLSPVTRNQSPVKNKNPKTFHAFGSAFTGVW